MQNSTKKPLVLGYFLAFLSIFFWGITFISTKYLLLEFTALEILFYRFIFAYIGLWLMHPKYEKVEFKDNIWFALAGLSGILLYQLFENLAINFTTASNVSVLVSICPLFTAVFTQIFLKEKHINLRFLCGFILAIAGVAMVSLNGSGELSFSPKGDILALAAGLCWGFYSVFLSIINRKNYNAFTITRKFFFFGFIFMIPFIFAGTTDGIINTMKFSWNFTRLLNPWNILNLAFLGIVASAFCFTAWNLASNIAGTVRISGGIYLIPVVTIIFAYFTLGEKISWMGLIGAVLTITGLFVSSSRKKEKSAE